MTNALIAGTAIAVATGLVGYFMVLRGQVFTGDALSHVSVTGALAALAFGIDARVGLFAATIAVGIGIALLGLRGRADDVVIGSVFAWVLGLGVLFLSIYTRSRSAGNGAAGVSVLFGSILSITTSRAYVIVAVGVAVVLGVLLIARPLLFSSVDEAVAAARGVPVRALGVAFLVLVGVCAAEAVQAVGALLLLGLLAGPAGVATRLTARPYRAALLSASLAVLAMWIGLAVAHAAPMVPPSFAIVGVASVFYALSFLAPLRRRGSNASM